MRWSRDTLVWELDCFVRITVVYKHHNNTIRLTMQHKAALTTCVYIVYKIPYRRARALGLAARAKVSCIQVFTGSERG